MKGITTSDFTFESIINKDALYVDKTEFIWKLVNSENNSYFLSRPRRFGKSLTVSTLEAFFQGKKELFKGLAIEKLVPHDIWQEWPVIRLDMAAASSSFNLEETVSGIKRLLRSCAEQYAITLPDDTPGGQFFELIDRLYKNTGKQVVVLIDEYDHPILSALQRPFISDSVLLLSSFYQQLKSANNKIRFVFVTGVSKFAHTSLFSGANNMVDLTRDAEFATMLGYTEKELKDNFSEYIQEGARRLNIPESELLESMKYWYDGFCFAPNAESVYNPVSIGRFFSNYEFNNYWCETGNPRFLIEQVKNRPLLFSETSKEWKLLDGFSKFDVENIDPEDLAVQTGYLTIKESMRDELGVRVRYDFPNKEIRDTWNTDILALTLNTWQSEVGAEVYKLRQCIKDGDADGFMQKLQWFFQGVAFGNTGSRDPEGVFRNYLHIILRLVSIPSQVEVQQATGQADLVAYTRDVVFVFELKLIDDDKKKDKALEDALEQAREKKYAEPYLDRLATVKRIGIAINSKTRQLVDWKSEEVKTAC